MLLDSERERFRQGHDGLSTIMPRCEATRLFSLSPGQKSNEKLVTKFSLQINEVDG